jgi:hypothetical protein
MGVNHAVAQRRSSCLPLQKQSGALHRKTSPYYAEYHRLIPEYIHTEGTICSVHALAFFVKTYFQDVSKHNEEIQWLTCKGDSRGLEEGIP